MKSATGALFQVSNLSPDRERGADIIPDRAKACPGRTCKPPILSGAVYDVGYNNVSQKTDTAKRAKPQITRQ